MKPFSLLVATLLSLSCLSCETARTEILVAIDSDLAVPTELDRLFVDAIGPDAVRQRAEGDLSDGRPLPRSLGIVHTSGPLGPFQVTVTGQLDGATVLTRRARVTFEKGKTLVLPMHLVRSCLSNSCGSGQTCTETGCRAEDVSSADLTPYDGNLPSLSGSPAPPPPSDASMPDADEGDAG